MGQPVQDAQAAPTKIEDVDVQMVERMGGGEADHQGTQEGAFAPAGGAEDDGVAALKIHHQRELTGGVGVVH